VATTSTDTFDSLPETSERNRLPRSSPEREESVSALRSRGCLRSRPATAQISSATAAIWAKVAVAVSAVRRSAARV
jgi:hypothetical protein